MYPVLLKLGSISIYSFGLLLAIGILAGVYYIWKHGRLAALPEERLLDAIFVTIAGGLIGARLLYVLSNWAIYADDLGSALAIWKGGLSFWGALLGGVITILIVAKRTGWPVGQLFDLAAPAVALGSFFGYLGAFLNGSSYGGVTSFIWGIQAAGVEGLRHPSQVLEALLQLLILVLLLKINRRAPYGGFLALTYLVVYSFGRFILEFLRGDQTHLIGPFSQAHFLSLVIGTTCVTLIYLRLARLRGSWRVNIGSILKASS